MRGGGRKGVESSRKDIGTGVTVGSGKARKRQRGSALSESGPRE